MTCNDKPSGTCKGIYTSHTLNHTVEAEPKTTCKDNVCRIALTTTTFVTCKHCGSRNVVKNGMKGRAQLYLCRDCGHSFVDNAALPRMRFPPEQIAAAIGMFYGGMSIDAIRRQMQSIYHVYPSDSTVYDWIIKFTKVAVKEAKISDIKVGDIWVADETVLKIDEGKDVWFWDIIDDKTRFLLASHISSTRTIVDARILMEMAAERTGKIPKVVMTDKLAAYLDGIELTFGAATKHITSKGFKVEPNTNLIERFHGTLKARTKVMRGLKNKETAKLIMDGWLVHYNFFRPHESLGDKTPGEIAKSTFKYKGWKDVIVGDYPTEGTRVSH